MEIILASGQERSVLSERLCWIMQHKASQLNQEEEAKVEKAIINKMAHILRMRERSWAMENILASGQERSVLLTCSSHHSIIRRPKHSKTLQVSQVESWLKPLGKIRCQIGVSPFRLLPI